MGIDADALAAKWIALQSMKNGSDEHRAAVIETMEFDALMRRDPEAFMQVVVAIALATSDPWVLANLGAGPVESFIRIHGDFARGEVSRAVSVASQLSIALDNVWDDE